MAAKGRRVVELGCGEAVGASILAESAAGYLGVDRDPDAIAVAREMWAAQNAGFSVADPLDALAERHESVVCLELAGRVSPEEQPRLFAAVSAALGEDGVAVVGAPRPGRPGATGMRAEALEDGMRSVFHTVFLFGQTGELVHASGAREAPYVLALACDKRSPGGDR
jgi:SAM-dependent methyltransferase